MILSKMRTIVNHPVDDVWTLVTDNSNYSWRSDIRSIIIKDSNSFVELDNNNVETTFTITNKELHHNYEFGIVNKNIRGHFIANFKAIGMTKCQLELIEMIKVNSWVMQLFGKMYLRKQQKRYIRDLKKKLGS